LWGPSFITAKWSASLKAKKNKLLNWNSVAKGLFVFSIGLAKKVLLADPLTSHAQSFFDAVTGTTVSAASAWFFSAEYTVSYYFDLSGYADMAIGIALLFNIVIPENFDSPYKARNFQDYWRRWHITLSRFLGAYVFKNIYKKNSKFRTYYFATMATFFVSGFWHGAGWTFVAWGLLNGFFVCTASWMKRKNFSFPCALSHFLTVTGIVLMRILFVSKTFAQSATVFKSLVNFSGTNFSIGLKPTVLMTIRLVAGIFIIAFMPPTKKFADSFKCNFKTLFLTALIAGLSVAFIGGTKSFLYFQF
jgi:D-alanyl-lipoteichoic acid acyltransferase DltB (MBOAT superfamily)